MNCPFRVFVALSTACFAGVGIARSAEPGGESEPTTIGYASVAEAFASVTAKPGVKIRVEGGKTIVEDLNGPTPAVWIFFPKEHPAYPSVIRRSIANSAAGASVETNVRCEAAKDVCDRYFGGK